MRVTSISFLIAALLASTNQSVFAEDLSSPGMDWAEDNFGWTDDEEKSISKFGLRDSNGNVTFTNTFSGFWNGTVFDYGVLSTGTIDQNGNNGSTGGGINVTVGGNIMNVITSGINNTVIVDADQTNTGDQSSTIELNGNLLF
ncbi:hypothetical protein [Maritalea sp.]|uniref:hypothetical protein n=1 Tax=Maritalea sp. TaxID=2003361 RepID=UPI0039E452FC